MLGLDVVLWMENPLYGIGGLVGIISYFIAYAISGDMIIAHYFVAGIPEPIQLW